MSILPMFSIIGNDKVISLLYNMIDMKITILTMFPQCFSSLLSFPVIKRAIDRGVLELVIKDIKDYGGGSFRHIDDSPCGGGKGMILRVDTLMRALSSSISPSSHTVLLSPKGEVYSQRKAREYSRMEDLVLVAGHYEGVDRRFEDHVDEMISIGDYILTGGEIPIMVIVDSISRLLGTIREGAEDDESHENGLLEYPQYTKPVDYMGEKVPSILLSGNHGAIDRWRKTQSLLDTKRLRPDLFEKYELSQEEKKLLESENEVYSS